MNIEFVHIDFESRSTTDLVKSGVYKYVEDKNTYAWCFSYEFNNDGNVYRWRPCMPDPIRLLEHVASRKTVKAHNAAFERMMWNVVLRANHGLIHWPTMTISQQDCTLARAAAIAHPQSLDTLAKALGATQKKDAYGSALMLKMCKPRKCHADGRIEWWDSEENIASLMDYCDQDIRTEAEVDTRLPPLTDKELRVWRLDQTINERGVPIDLNAAQRCAELVEYSKKRADAEMRSLTDRTVPKCSNDAKLVAWMNGRGIECTTVKKSVQDDLMFIADLKGDALVREVIELRKASKKTSTAKYKAMLVCVCSDDRIRGLLAYHGASTGRWAGRLVQPQNFPRLDFDEEGYLILWLHELLKNPALSIQDVYDMLTAIHGPSSPLLILSRALRSMIKAPAGKKFVGGDFSNIEGRMNAWFANETWKLQAFRDYDTIIGTDKKGKPKRAGPDLYNLAYARSFGVPVESVTKANRQIGKVEELALGYQGSIGAFIDMGDTYGLNPYDISGPVMLATSSRQWDITAMQYHKKGTNRFSLQEKEWTAIKVIVDNWRAANPLITQSWWDLQDAAIQAVSTPGQVVAVCGGRIQYYSDSRCLWCVLPGGRMLCYSSPNIKSEKVTRTKPDGSEYDTWRRTVTYWGVDSETRQWKELSLYGGLQCENIVQAASRDVMVDRMFAAEDAGYPIILTVHDELLAEPNADSIYHNDVNLQAIMSIVPKEFEGLPLAAATWEDTRYVK